MQLALVVPFSLLRVTQALVLNVLLFCTEALFLLRFEGADGAYAARICTFGALPLASKFLDGVCDILYAAPGSMNLAQGMLYASSMFFEYRCSINSSSTFFAIHVTDKIYI